MFMGLLKWMHLIRKILRGKNIMMTGTAGRRKIIATKSAANSIEDYNM